MKKPLRIGDWMALALLTIVAFVVWGDSQAATDFRYTPTSRVLYSDLVVRGVIRDLTTEVVGLKNFSPQTDNPNTPFPITILTVEVGEVINGVWDDPTLSVIVPGGFPDGVVYNSKVDVQIMTSGFPFRYNYAKGDETVLCVRFDPAMKGGSYMVVTDEGRFIRTDAGWENQGTGETSSIEEIRQYASEASPESVLEQADLVATSL